MRESNFKVGDRVQYWERAGISTGTVDSVIPPIKLKTDEYYRLSAEDKKEMETYALVKWDDVEGELLEKILMYELDSEDTPLEKEFRTTAEKANNEIAAKLALASKALGEAIDISEKYGIPFSSSVSSLRQGYMPYSYDDKFTGVSRELMEAVTGCYNECSGWKHSKVCY